MDCEDVNPLTYLIHQVFSAPPIGVNKNEDYFLTLDEVLSQKDDDGVFMLTKLLEGWRS
jgi:hypothetical protein